MTGSYINHFWQNQVTGMSEQARLYGAVLYRLRLPEEMVQKAVETVQKLQPFDEICVTRAGCTVSSHCGPGTIGVLYIRKAEA